MTLNGRSFLLDANVLIEAYRRYYAFDLCPGFWDCLLFLHKAECLCSIDRVRDELEKGNDDLAVWSKQTPSDFFISTNDTPVIENYSKMVTWVHEQEQFYDEAKSDFSRNADGWLTACAKAKGMIIVTHEIYSSGTKKSVKIPNVCKAFNVPYVDTFEMLRDLGVAFHWDP